MSGTWVGRMLYRDSRRELYALPAQKNTRTRVTQVRRRRGASRPVDHQHRPHMPGCVEQGYFSALYVSN